MIFTSYTYIFFLGLVFVLHWSIPVSWRKPLLIVASYAFYCSWRWEYGFLLLGVSLFNWAYALRIVRASESSFALMPGILVNLGLLAYFKYAGFLLSNASSLAVLVGVDWHPTLPEILLPLGISFFTFQGVAYLLDVASGEEPFKSLSDFLLYKGFWPQLIAGPIIRPGEIHDQIRANRPLDYGNIAEGGRRILEGLFKKTVLADTLAPFADQAFQLNAALNLIDAAAGILAFGLQIYFDFSAYSDIAVGSARLFGFVFPENFNWPYSARSPQEFWNRWHMTLSRWIRDYLFTPLSFMARNHPWSAFVWLLVAMAVCGLWHGAQWTFVAWGLWHGLLLILNQTLLKRFFSASSMWRIFLAHQTTLILVMLGWIFFRAHSLEHCGRIFTSLLTMPHSLRPNVLRENDVLQVALIYLGLMIVQAVHARLESQPLAAPPSFFWVRVLRPAMFSLMILAVIILHMDARTFVYFQF